MKKGRAVRDMGRKEGRRGTARGREGGQSERRETGVKMMGEGKPGVERV